MKGKNPLLYHLLRVLTPDELNELTTTSKGRNLVSLTKMLQKDMAEESKVELEGAKVLPFKRKEEAIVEEEEQLTEVVISCGERCRLALDDHIKRITILDRNYSKNCPVVQETSTFIINEKDRFKENYNKIKSKEVISLYQKNASVDMGREKMDDISSSTNIGVLVNKKQA